MKITTKNRTTKSYKFTIESKNDIEGFNALAELRASIKEYNKTSSKKKRVCVRGRLGKNNSFYDEIYKYSSLPSSRNFHVKFDHATRFDVYVNDSYS